MSAVKCRAGEMSCEDKSRGDVVAGKRRDTRENIVL